ncbi:MAG: GNAT family N-acetyltransferase [Chloroflexi bacterium]|nr:GNAT family N-acetyltransferase [Chloroflexota bacterium]MDA1219171.1 GNAT family N-acetyltransferase [Chloroflexota bacterium]
MSTTTIYPVPGYPTTYLTEDSAPMIIRPMVPEDEAALLDFFKTVPEEDRYFLKEDVVDPRVIQHWAENLDYSRVLPLLAIMDDKIIGEGTLHHRRAGARQHIGELRIVVDPAYRNRGVGRGLLHKLIDVAGDKGLKKLMFEVVADTEEAAKHTAMVLGFVPVAALPHHVRDLHGNVHHVVILERELLDPSLSADEEIQNPAPVF